MKKAIIFSALLLSNAVFADTITLRADHWYPMNGTPGDPLPGYMVEIAQKTLAKGGHTVDYALMPWERALNSARKGEIDCVVGAYKSDAPELIFPDVSLGVDHTAAFVKAANTWRYSDLAGLKTLKVGAISGYSYGDELDNWIKENKAGVQLTVGDTALEQNIRKLAAGRVDTVLESPAVFNAKAKQMNMEGQFVQAGLLSNPENLYIACTPTKPAAKDWIKLINDGTQALRESGELAEILARYGLKDWQ